VIPISFQDKKNPARKWRSESPALLWASSHYQIHGIDANHSCDLKTIKDSSFTFIDTIYFFFAFIFFCEFDAYFFYYIQQYIGPVFIFLIVPYLNFVLWIYRSSSHNFFYKIVLYDFEFILNFTKNQKCFLSFFIQKLIINPRHY
jgi:hypothetical protein